MESYEIWIMEVSMQIDRNKFSTTPTIATNGSNQRFLCERIGNALDVTLFLEQYPPLAGALGVVFLLTMLGITYRLFRVH
ncbi:MAG: hypothetical protein HKN87_18265 [Saprospiraceae bacterium]|nr:hypothetical protein [Saprospiraceae bacterium]